MLLLFFPPYEQFSSEQFNTTQCSYIRGFHESRNDLERSQKPEARNYVYDTLKVGNFNHQHSSYRLKNECVLIERIARNTAKM